VLASIEIVCRSLRGNLLLLSRLRKDLAVLIWTVAARGLKGTGS